jgi:hypothetical protein
MESLALLEQGFKICLTLERNDWQQCRTLCLGGRFRRSAWVSDLPRQRFAIEPLYPCVPLAVKTDPALHELLGLVDALRCGRVREQQLAAVVLAQRLGT